MTGNPSPWDQGRVVAAVGRQYVVCPINTVTPLIGLQPSAAGAPGDVLDQVWLFPTDLTPAGAVEVRDDTTVVWRMPAGTTLIDLRPIFVPLNFRALVGPWRVSTPADLWATAGGIFS